MSSFQLDIIVPQKWYGFDFNRTLAHYTSYDDDMAQAAPILPMLNKLKQYLAEGKYCKIMSASLWFPPLDSSLAKEHPEKARAYYDRAVNHMFAIQAWCEKHVGQVLESTCEIDPGCQEIWNDKAWHVVPNMGLTPGAPYVLETEAAKAVADLRRIVPFLALELPAKVYDDVSARIWNVLNLFPDNAALAAELAVAHAQYPIASAESFPIDSTAQPKQTPGTAGDAAQLPVDAGHDAPPPAG